MRLHSIFLVFLLVGCQQSQSLLQHLDLLGFRWFGQSLLSDTGYVRIKEVHLNNRVLLGKPVIVAGTLQKLGEQRTYLVMADNSASLVVDLTALAAEERAELIAEQRGSMQLKVFGVVSISSKGHPHVLARALRPLTDIAI